ncbi:hypothetical protein FWH30_02510 [Microgenomates group bacterium]|nr:hypothetical protein [Microgenomates group bacterium]
MNKVIVYSFVSAFFALASSVSAQSISWQAPKYTGATECQKVAEIKYDDLREDSKEKTAIDQGLCVPITALQAVDAQRQVCADNFNITYVDKAIFPDFEPIDIADISDPDNYQYAPTLCATGRLCVVCTQGNLVSASQGTTTASPSPSPSPSPTTSSPPPNSTPSSSASPSAQTPVSGVLENTLLLLLVGGLVIGLGSYHLVRNRA